MIKKNKKFSNSHNSFNLNRYTVLDTVLTNVLSSFDEKSTHGLSNYFQINLTCPTIKNVAPLEKIFTSSQPAKFLSHSVSNVTSFESPIKFNEAILLFKSKLNLNSNLSLLKSNNFNSESLYAVICKQLPNTLSNLTNCVYITDFDGQTTIGDRHRSSFLSINPEFNGECSSLNNLEINLSKYLKNN